MLLEATDKATKKSRSHSRYVCSYEMILQNLKTANLRKVCV